MQGGVVDETKLNALNLRVISGIWVIETLAQYNEVDTSLILDLLKKFPQISDNLGRNARELVSFRILENFLFRGAQSNSLSSSSSPKIAFDPSKSCEDVLRQILRETPTLTLRATGPEMWKWDVQAFLAHKRTSFGFGNHSLLQLKDAILDGSRSFLASFKERSGLSFGNQPESGLLENKIERTDSNNCVGQGNDHVSPASVDNGHPDLPNKKLLPVKRKRSATIKNVGGKACKDQIISKNGCENNTNCFKKNDIIQDAGWSLISSDVNKQLADKMLMMVKYSDIGLHRRLENDNDERVYLKDTGGFDEVLPRKKQTTCCNIEFSNDRCDDKNGLENEIREAEGDEGDEGLCEKGLEKIEVPNEKNHDAESAGENEGIHELKSTAESCRNVPDPKDVDFLSDNDEYHDESTDIAKKKKAFLSSQCTFSQGANNSTQLNVCMKCNKGGQVLVCSTNGCPLVIHERCSSRLSFGTMGEFYCPFCVYSQAMSSYMDAKKEVSLKRKDLANFVRLEARKETKKQPERGDCLHKSDELNIEDTADCINNHRPKKILESGQEESSGDNHSFRGKVVGLTNEAPYPLTIYREERKDKGQMQKSNRSENNAIIRSKKGAICSSKTYLSGESNCLVHIESDGALEIFENSGVPKHTGTYLSGESKCLVHIESDGALEVFENSGVPKHSSRVQKHKRISAHPEIPQLRRRKVPWTTAEEEKLKEGIRRFCNPDENIPWKQILDFGAGVFQQSRITGDLKDKWRNLCKAHPQYESLLKR